tara:strand:+ start:264 stop:749 length:486 start_codon:yes stop_codon:yes gene_type:complete
MGSPSASTGGGSNRYEPPKKKNPVVEFVKGGGITGAVIRGIKKGAAESKAKKEANVEMGLGTDRMSNYSTGQGGTRSDGGNSNVGAATSSGMVVQAPKVTSPTTAEVSQVAPEVTSEEARDAANLLIKKRKGRGRSSTILTSAQGVQDNKGLTLGKPSLLG